MAEEKDVQAGLLNASVLGRWVRVPQIGGDREGKLVLVVHGKAVHGPGAVVTLELQVPGGRERVRVAPSSTVTVVTR